MSYNTLTFEVADNVATITLMRPDAANALNGEAFREIWEASLRCDDDPEVRAVALADGHRHQPAKCSLYFPVCTDARKPAGDQPGD